MKVRKLFLSRSQCSSRQLHEMPTHTQSVGRKLKNSFAFKFSPDGALGLFESTVTGDNEGGKGGKRVAFFAFSVVTRNFHI